MDILNELVYRKLDSQRLKRMCGDWFVKHNLYWAESILEITAKYDCKINGAILNISVTYGEKREVIDIAIFESDITGYSSEEFTNKLHKKLVDTIYTNMDHRLWAEGHMHISEPDKPLDIKMAEARDAYDKLFKSKLPKDPYASIKYITCNPMTENEVDINKTPMGTFDAFDGVRYFDIKTRKENEKMATPVNKTNDVLQAKINEIYDIYNLKMSQLEVECNQEIEKLRKEHDHERYVEQAKEAAFRQKAKLDALVEAGFSKKEAMDMVMKDLENK